MRYCLSIRYNGELIDKVLSDTLRNLYEIKRRYQKDTGLRYEYLIYDNKTGNFV